MSDCIKIYNPAPSPYLETPRVFDKVAVKLTELPSNFVATAQPYSKLCLQINNFTFMDGTPFLFMNGEEYIFN